MGCTHPGGVTRITDDDGNVVGVRCPLCGSVAFKGESFWTTLRRNFPRVLRGKQR